MTGERPLVTGTPVAVGVVILGIALTAMLLSLGRAPGPASKLSQEYMRMMAGSLAPTVQSADAGALARALAGGDLGFVPRIVNLEPEFTLLGGHRHTFEGRPAAGRLEDLGTPDDVRRDAGVTLLIFRKTTQTIACWQEGRLVYVFISTLPGEIVVALARRQAARAPSPR